MYGNHKETVGQTTQRRERDKKRRRNSVAINTFIEPPLKQLKTKEQQTKSIRERRASVSVEASTTFLQSSASPSSTAAAAPLPTPSAAHSPALSATEVVAKVSPENVQKCLKQKLQANLSNGIKKFIQIGSFSDKVSDTSANNVHWDSTLYMLSSALGASAPLSPSAQATINKHLPKLSTKRLIQHPLNVKPAVQTADAACLTDLCSTENLPEVEIFSLLEEQIPKYKVRSDFLTEFSGYSNQDWFVPAPALEIPPDGLGLTKEQTRETLNYFLLCGNRVSQMTRAYDDIEAVTRLLEEKEKDLELTVQIGKELLTQNNLLENRLAELEGELKSANEDRSQLVHELHKKNELISVLTNDGEDTSDNDTPVYSKSITLDLLQKKILTLQDENKSLKIEASQLACQTDEVEAHERQLMDDISLQLNDANKQFEGLSLELERQREENRLQHEQIVSLTARLSEAEMRLHQLTHDNDEHITLLNITKENQNSLALELVEFKQRYQEVLALLQETQEQLRKQRKKTLPQARSSFLSTLGGLQPDSLQSELMESSLYSENSIDSGISGDNQRVNDRIGRLMSQLPGASNCGNSSMNSSGICAFSGGTLPPYKRVFDTVRCATKSGNFADSEITSMTHLGAMSMSSASGPRMSTMPFVGGPNPNNTSFCRDAGMSLGMGVKTLSYESINSQSDDGYPSQPSGVPGAPGAKELEAALKRLTPAEVLARRAMLSYAPAGTYSYDDQQPTAALPLGVRTPDSIMSTGSSGISSSTNMSSSMHQWRLPEKLQIVKPIEGSQTLHHWTRLATPTLSGLLEERPGVTIRGGRGLDDLGMQVYTLSDVEEDVSDELPGKQFEFSGCTYTYTTSTVMHPDDGLLTDLSFLSQSQVSSRMASTSTSRQPSCPPTPRAGLSRKNSCSTFSVNLGLASMLNERGIKAVTPSALNTPAGPNFSPTVTPCNSPEGSPTRSMSPEPLFGLLSSGADLIRRKLVGGDIERPNRNQQHQKQQKIMLTRLERRALRSLRLVEKVESIGLENIITTQPNAMSQLASGIANRSASPMAQLTSLKNIHTNSNNLVNDLHFDRNQIKDVLQKGLHPQEQQTPTSSKSLAGGGASKTSDKREPKLKQGDSKQQQQKMHKLDDDAQSTTGSIMSDLENSSIRAKQMLRQKSRRNLKNGQRPDLGTIGGRVRTDLGRVSPKQHDQPLSTRNKTSGSISKYNSSNNKDHDTKEAQQSITQSFVGTVSSLLFGRKGGWL